MATVKKAEYQKSEPILGIDKYDKPTVISGPNAWANLILNLMYTIPGSYPSLPSMGIGLQFYEYGELHNTINELSAKIIEQATQYLPNVPLSNVKVSELTMSDGNIAILIDLVFIVNNNYTSRSIALNSKSFLDFEVSWNN